MDAKPVVLKSDNSSSAPFFKPKFNLKIVGLIVVVLALILGIGAGVYLIKIPLPFAPKASTQASELYFNPADLDVKPDGEFETDVFIDTKDLAISGVEVSVKFDPNYLSLVSFEKGQFLENRATEPEISSGSATLTLLATPPNAKKGVGSLAKLKFKALKETSAATEVSLDSSKTQVASPDSDTNTISSLRKAFITIKTASSSATPFPVQTFTGSATPSSGSLSVDITKYDFNGDGKVNSLDLSFMYVNWGTPKSSDGGKADINGDGVVNGVDYAMLLKQFN